MFSLTLENPDVLKNTMSIVSEMIDEGVLKIDSNGLSLLSPDRNVIVVVDFKLLSTAFSDFQLTQPTTVGVNFSNLVSILKRTKSNEKVTLRLKDNKLEVIVEGGGKRKFDLPTLDLKSENPPIDQLAFTGRVDLESGVFEQGVEDADVVSDSMVFELNQEVFRLRAKGDISSAELELKKGENGMLNLEASEAMRARYPIDYLKKISKACKLAKQVSLEFGNNYPIRISFTQMDKVNLNFILAPRIADEE